MLCKIILLCCIINFMAAAVSPDKVKISNKCRSIGGRCVTVGKCLEQDGLGTVCKKGRVCCALRKQKRGNVIEKRKSKGCKQKHRCRKSGGRCIPAKQQCQGRVKDGACKENICQCCIIKDGDRPHTKLRVNRKKEKPPKENKKDKGCKKKKKCKGFCVGKNEECLGDIDPKGCKGKHCSCCTLREKNEKKEKKESSDMLDDYSYGYDYSGSGFGHMYEDYYDYYDYYYGSGHYGKGCSGKNINGSCEDKGCFICGDGQCFPTNFKCDRYGDCEDGSDELGCPQPPKIAPGSCPTDYAWVLHSCYRVVARPSSWLDARMVCQAVNGDLALIYDHTLFTAYMKAFYEIEQAVYWVGIHRDNGTYTWVNGTLLPEDSSLWGSMESPTTGKNGEDCVVLNITENRLQPTSCEVDTYNNKSIYTVCEYVENEYYSNNYEYYH